MEAAAAPGPEDAEQTRIIHYIYVEMAFGQTRLYNLMHEGYADFKALQKKLDEAVGEAYGAEGPPKAVAADGNGMIPLALDGNRRPGPLRLATGAAPDAPSGPLVPELLTAILIALVRAARSSDGS